jgi:hypothetical protein
MKSCRWWCKEIRLGRVKGFGVRRVRISGGWARSSGSGREAGGKERGGVRRNRMWSVGMIS